MNQMDDFMKQFQENLIEIEIDAENLLLARHQVMKCRYTIQQCEFSFCLKVVLNCDINSECSWLKMIELGMGIGKRLQL